MELHGPKKGKEENKGDPPAGCGRPGENFGKVKKPGLKMEKREGELFRSTNSSSAVKKTEKNAEDLKGGRPS